MNTIAGFVSLVLPLVGALAGWVSPGYAMTVTALDIAEGSVAHHGRFHRVLDRLLDQDGIVKMGEYQPIGDLVPSITRGRTTFSLFTSGFTGAPPPSATIDGSSIVADLSSLFFGVSRGAHFKVWNIGGPATGTFDPDTLEFCLTWEHLFGDRHRGGPATFSLQGKVITGVSTAPVPLVTTLVLFATGLVLLLGVWRQRMISGLPGPIAAA